MNKDKYVKIVYQSKPIGEQKIILYLTSFDKEKYEKDLIEKQDKIEICFDKIDLSSPEFIKNLEKNLNTLVKNFYEEKINELYEKEGK